jgi:hypothetical protein
MSTFENIILFVALTLFFIAINFYKDIYLKEKSKRKLLITELVKMRLQMIDILKSGKYSKEELDYITSGDKYLIKLTTEYGKLNHK